MLRSAFSAFFLAVACGQGQASRPVRPQGGGAGAPAGVIITPPFGCAGSNDTAGAGADADEPEPLCGGTVASVSYARQVAPLVSCTGEVCHQAWSYDKLVGKASMACCDHRLIVDPGRPSSSHLVQAVSGSADSCVGRMGALGDGQIQTIIDWICEGAPND
jgi:hypothetical protein